MGRTGRGEKHLDICNINLESNMAGGGSQHGQRICSQGAKKDPLRRIVLLVAQLSLLGFSTKCKQGHSETTDLEHYVPTKKGLFGEPNFQALSQGAEISGCRESLFSSNRTGISKRRGARRAGWDSAGRF